MKRFIGHISILVDEYDTAIEYYTQTLPLELIEDKIISFDKRWVLVGTSGGNGFSILLAKAVGDEQKSRIGNQTGGRVFLFLYTDDFQRDYIQLKSKGVEFVREPKNEEYGMVAVFKDLYGNLWDLLELKLLPLE